MGFGLASNTDHYEVQSCGPVLAGSEVRLHESAVLSYVKTA